MKIVFITNRYAPDVVGGAEITVQTLAEELFRRGNDVRVITLAAAAEASQESVNGVCVHRLVIKNIYPAFSGAQTPARRLAWHLRDLHNEDAARNIGNLLDQLRPDVVSTHNIGGMGVVIWREIRARGIKLVHTLHDYYLLCPKVTMFSKGRNCLSQCLTCRAFAQPKKNESHKVDIVVGISKFILEAHLSRGLFSNARKAVIYNSRVLDVNATKTMPVDLPSTPLRLGFMGRLEREKGIEMLLGALAELKPKTWTLTAAGRPSGKAYLQYLQETYPLEGVNYLGFVKPSDFYPQVDVLVVPSLWNEPLGVVAFESMGYGVPVIASNRGGLPEVIGESDAGWIFDAGEQRSLTAVISEVINGRDKLSLVRAASLARRNYFTPARHADEFLLAVGEL